MSHRRAVLIAGFMIVVGMGSAASAPDSESPEAFLRKIYAAYLGKAHGVSLDGAGPLRRFFTPALAGLIDTQAQAAKRRGDVPELDGDPFVAAQDWRIEALAIAVKQTGPDSATGIVTFKNFGKPVTVTHILAKTAQGWRIDEIVSPDGSLRALVKTP